MKPGSFARQTHHGFAVPPLIRRVLAGSGIGVLLLSIAMLATGMRCERSVYARQGETKSPGLPANQRTGDAACMGCHAEQARLYGATAHHLTSQIADRSNVLGSFDPGDNVLLISGSIDTPDEPRLSFRMDVMGDGLYQTAIAELGEKRLTSRARFDLTIGSGVRGQTYLSWSGNQLFEMPVSYWTQGHQWINSPGYEDGTANFRRPAVPRCMECHTSFIHALSADPQSNAYDRASLIPGIGCETCHGPGAQHVAIESAASAKTEASRDPRIINPAKLERDRQVDGCALCHNGIAREELAPAFSYLPGQSLDRYLAPNPLDAVDHPDVHGNQVGLLKRSRCYLSSPTMSCATCHDVHAPERTAASYSERCLSCHRWQSCGASKQLGESVRNDCIRCHMPLQNTAAIVSITAGRVVRASIRTHWIKVYPETSPAGAPAHGVVPGS